MSDQVVDHYRAMVVMKGKSNLPEDTFVNTWTFKNFNVGSPHGAIVAVLEAFYNGVFSPHLKPVASFLSSLVLQPKAEIRTYDLGQPAGNSAAGIPPREPTVTEFDLALSGSMSGIPEECSTVLSFYAGRNIPTKRGRIYLGPLHGDALQQLPEGRTQVSGSFRGVILAAAENVLNTSQPVGWSVLSPTTTSADLVTAGWVDNAFDTQRRRGLAPTVRTVFPAPAA